LKKGIFMNPMKSESSSPLKKSRPQSSSFAAVYGSPWMTKLKNVDSMVVHNDKVEKSLNSPLKSKRVTSPTRNPIVQDTDELTKPHVSSYKVDLKAYKTSIFSADDSDHIQLFSAKTRVHAAPRDQIFTEPEEKSEGIRMVNTQPRRNPIVSEPEERRVRSPQPWRSSFNPITEGDPEGVVAVKPRIYENVESDQKRINDRKAFLSADRGLSPTKGRVFRESAFSFTTEPSTQALPRALSPAEKKVRGTISDVIQYADNQRIRDTGVSGKCTQANMEQVVKATVENDRTFSRKKVTH